MRGNQSTDQETNSLGTITSNIRETDGDNLNRKRSLSPMDYSMKKCTSEEIMLVDEVDVFFGPEFYGRKLSFCVLDVSTTLTCERNVNSQ